MLLVLEKEQKKGLEKKEDIVSDFFKCKCGKQMVQQFDINQAFVDEKFISQNVFSLNQNKLSGIFLSFIAYNQLSSLDLLSTSTLNKVWLESNSRQSVKHLLPGKVQGEAQENINDNNIDEKNSVLDAINKIKDEMESENGDNKSQTDFYDGQNSFEK